MLLALGIWSASHHPIRSGQVGEVTRHSQTLADASNPATPPAP